MLSGAIRLDCTRPHLHTLTIFAPNTCYSYVLSSVAITGVVVQWMAIKVGMARRTRCVMWQPLKNV